MAIGPVTLDGHHTPPKPGHGLRVRSAAASRLVWGAAPEMACG
jgi:hypothetical protein